MTTQRTPSAWAVRLKDDTLALRSFTEYIERSIAACERSRDEDSKLNTIEAIALHHARITARIAAYRGILAYVNGTRGETDVAIQTERGD